MLEITSVVGIPKSYRIGYNIQGDPFKYLQHPHLEKFCLLWKYFVMSIWSLDEQGRDEAQGYLPRKMLVH